ncbi:hypothetical protein GGG16DRAFT_67795 [Schizophyllum commune]
MTWRREPGDDEEALSLVFHRSTILRHANRRERVVAWKDWGPKGARWLYMSFMSYSYITTTTGQRYVQKPSVMISAPEQQIHVLDFNPHTVRRVEAQLLAQAKEAGEQDRERQVIIDTPTATIVLSAEHEPGQPWPQHQGMNYMPPWDAWPEQAFIEEPPEIQHMDQLFVDARSLEPGLPFVRTISKQRFGMDVVVMDNERIIGMSTDWTANTIGLHTLYFG